ncbi:uncharacterized protein LOC113229907 [Hyposmocoma kahamanoa]|uniref:uncharacterized protein LOC113229907 n=1 Tax=Hyposmocoma kahamanoa TaxID=1477025 RepID=UPI000E6D671C|nr:uncharacterized protein LOC113229907 [Hyposmocoma kahamanoa]
MATRTNQQGTKKNPDFNPYNITPESAHTAVLLLESKEPEILCHTLRAITKFAAQDKTDTTNREVLFNLDAIKYILQHIDHPELTIKRFALKALAQLCQLPRGPDQVLSDPVNLRRIAFLLSKMEDVFVLEFASLVLAELTTGANGSAQLVDANILGVLFSRMKNSPDPDVQKNCLQTFSNLLAYPQCVSEVTKNPQFSWPSILALMQSKFLALQHAAITTVEQLVSRFDDLAVQKTFKASTGVLDLCDILESYEFRDVHAQILGVLHTYVGTEDNTTHVYQSGCILRLLSYLEMALPAMKPLCLAVLTKMSYFVEGRNALFETGTDLVFCRLLPTANTDLLEDSAMGVANMTKLMPSAVRMADTNIIQALCTILSDDTTAWFNVRMNVLLALAELCRIIPKAAFSAVEHKTFSSLRDINRNYKMNPIEAQHLAVQCYLNLLSYHVSTKAMLTGDFIKELISILQRPHINLKIMTTNVLTGLMAEEIAKYLFNDRRGEETVDTNLRIEHVGLQTALCNLIIASVTDEGADEYLALGTIHFMVENKEARYKVKVWEPALEAIFRHHPSAKLAYAGRLDINDFTAEGFYVQKRLDDFFPTMAEIVQTPPPHRQPVFVILFYPPPLQPPSGCDIRTPHNGSTSHYELAATSSGRIRFPPVPDDVNLRTYLMRLKLWFGDPAKSLHYIEIQDSVFEVRQRDKCAEVSSSLKECAKVLADYVCEQMSGLAQERDCSMPGVNLHLADLMMDLNSRVIGLGWVRVGGALERALLYKVLADRIGLPCALYRVSSAHAWCEVAVPDLPTEELEEHTVKQYPAGLLRPNYVVDLTLQQGKLHPVGSVEARRITGPKCAPLYLVRQPPRICVCEHNENNHL